MTSESHPEPDSKPVPGSQIETARVVERSQAWRGPIQARSLFVAIAAVLLPVSAEDESCTDVGSTHIARAVTITPKCSGDCSAGLVEEDSLCFDPTFGTTCDPQMLQMGVGLALGHRSPTAGLEELP